MSVDCIVTAQRDYEGTLTHLKVREIQDGEAMEAEARTKEAVVEDILHNDRVYYSATPDESEDSYVLRKKIRVVEENTDAYLRTDDQTLAEDALKPLPKF